MALVRNDLYSVVKEVVEHGGQISEQSIQIGELHKDVTNVTNDGKEIARQIGVLSQNKLDLLAKRKNDILRENTSKVKKYKYPSWWNWKDAPINIYSDATHFFTDLDVSKFKNTGGKNIYVDPVKGTSSNNGLTEATPTQSLLKAYMLASDNDTIICMDGIYKRPSLMENQKIEKNLNIIAKNKGKAFLFYADDHTYTKTINYKNVYQTTRSNVKKVVDISLLDAYNQTVELTKVNDLATCETTEGSWYSDNTNLYVHMYGQAIPDNSNVVALLSGQGPIYVDCQTKNVNLYVEGIRIFGSNTGNIFFANSAQYKTPNIYGKDCGFHYASGDMNNGNSVNILGAAIAIFQNCICDFSTKDGFNYHAQNGTVTNAIEINCVGKTNGDNSIVGAENTNNGSTIHDGGKAIRINGTYYENMGCNVADVHIGTQSLNLGCVGYNSKSQVQDMTNSDFGTQQPDAVMLLDSCVSFGSLHGITSYSGTKVHIKNTLYETKQGGGSIVEE